MDSKKDLIKKKVKVSVIYEKDEKELEFHLPEYMNEIENSPMLE